MIPNAAADPAIAQAPRDNDSEPPVGLLADREITDLRHRWDEIQGGFIDEPRSAVEKADKLVGEAVANLTDAFGRMRKELDGQWNRGDSVSTEDLRQALRRYRAFFSRLLNA